MIRVPLIAFCCAVSLTTPAQSAPQTTQNQASRAAVLPSYATTAWQVLGAPLILDGRIRSAVRIKGAEAANVAAGHVRFYIEADVTALIRGSNAISTRIGYV